MNMMMEDEEVVQMVDDDEVENVGIMSGFMDDIEELMEEISEAEMNGIEEGEDADMARMMNRTPDSPEILMNNLRGDMRSIDARREELADLVGQKFLMLLGRNHAEADNFIVLRSFVKFCKHRTHFRSGSAGSFASTAGR